MTLKRTQVMLLPTNEKAIIGDFVLGINQDSKLMHYGKKVQEPFNTIDINHNLYFLSDEKIKEGDWVFCLRDGFEPVVQQRVNPEEVNKDPMMKKIIATTDSSLTYQNKDSQTGNNTYIVELPQPSPDFIKVFVDAYNAGKPIEWVDVENEERYPYQHELGKKYLQLKVNSKNEITIRKVKESWSREEVIELLSKHFVDAGSKIGLGNNVTEFTKKWISENL